MTVHDWFQLVLCGVIVGVTAVNVGCEYDSRAETVRLWILALCVAAIVVGSIGVAATW